LKNNLDEVVSFSAATGIYLFEIYLKIPVYFEINPIMSPECGWRRNPKWGCRWQYANEQNWGCHEIL